MKLRGVLGFHNVVRSGRSPLTSHTRQSPLSLLTLPFSGQRRTVRCQEADANRRVSALCNVGAHREL
jgi:hypothetical protein